MEVKINLTGIKNVSTSTKMVDTKDECYQVTTISFQIKDMAPSQIARILNLQRRRYPLDAVIQSAQAEMDLRLVPVNVETGELSSDESIGNRPIFD